MLHYLDATDDDLMLWFGLLVLAVVLAVSTADPCEDLIRGTDAYFECMTGAEIDLTPTEGR